MLLPEPRLLSVQGPVSGSENLLSEDIPHGKIGGISESAPCQKEGQDPGRRGIRRGRRMRKLASRRRKVELQDARNRCVTAFLESSVWRHRIGPVASEASYRYLAMQECVCQYRSIKVSER